MQSPASLPLPGSSSNPNLPPPASTSTILGLPIPGIGPLASVSNHGSLGIPARTHSPVTSPSTKDPPDPPINPNSITGPEDKYPDDDENEVTRGPNGEIINTRGDAKGRTSGGGGIGLRVSKTFFRC
jgi:hypothetical protein